MIGLWLALGAILLMVLLWLLPRVVPKQEPVETRVCIITTPDILGPNWRFCHTHKTAFVKGTTCPRLGPL